MYTFDFVIIYLLSWVSKDLPRTVGTSKRCTVLRRTLMDNSVISSDFLIIARVRDSVVEVEDAI